MFKTQKGGVGEEKKKKKKGFKLYLFTNICPIQGLKATQCIGLLCVVILAKKRPSVRSIELK